MSAVLATGRIAGLVLAVAMVGVIVMAEVVEAAWNRNQDRLYPLPEWQVEPAH